MVSYPVAVSHLTSSCDNVGELQHGRCEVVSNSWASCNYKMCSDLPTWWPRSDFVCSWSHKRRRRHATWTLKRMTHCRQDGRRPEHPTDVSSTSITTRRPLHGYQSWTS